MFCGFKGLFNGSNNININEFPNQPSIFDEDNNLNSVQFSINKSDNHKNNNLYQSFNNFEQINDSENSNGTRYLNKKKLKDNNEENLQKKSTSATNKNLDYNSYIQNSKNKI